MTQFLKGEIEGYVAKEKAPAGESGGGSANMMVVLAVLLIAVAVAAGVMLQS